MYFPTLKDERTDLANEVRFMNFDVCFCIETNLKHLDPLIPENDLTRRHRQVFIATVCSVLKVSTAFLASYWRLPEKDIEADKLEGEYHLSTNKSYQYVYNRLKKQFKPKSRKTKKQKPWTST